MQREVLYPFAIFIVLTVLF